MPAYRPDTLESDLVAIFGARPVPAPRGGGERAAHLAILVAVFAVLAISLLHRMPGPQFAPILAVVQPALVPPAASAYVAAPALPRALPEWTPARTAPRVVVADTAPPRAAMPPREKTTKTRRPEPQALPAALPTRERLTLAQAIPSEEERNNEGTLAPVDPGRIQIRAARLEAVDAIRTLRLR